MTLSDVGSIQELQTIMIFGIGSLLLYLVVPVALFANEVRLAKQSDDTSGTAAIFNSLFQAFFYIIAWSIFVSVIVFMVIKFGRADDTNPAVGIDRYWNIMWLEPNITSQLNTTFPVTTGETITERNKAELLVMILTWAKAIEYLLLGVLLGLSMKLTMSLPLVKLRRADHYKMTSQIDIGTLMSTFMIGILGWVVFTTILELESILLTSLIQSYSSTSEDSINILNDLKDLLRLGIEKIKLINKG